MTPGLPLGEVVSEVRDALSAAGIPSADREAVLLSADALGLKPIEVSMRRAELLDEGFVREIKGRLARRLEREPLQYISGVQDFRGLEMRVSPGVFIPRPETEILVDEALKALKAGSPLVLDLCTGSGCVAVAIAKELPGVRVVAIDISGTALSTAIENARFHGVEQRMDFIRGDLFDALGNGYELAFDAITANPPYIADADIEGLDPEVSLYEPRAALSGGEDGLDFYRRMARGCPAYLKAGGALVMEMGYGQSDDVEEILKATGVFIGMEKTKDLFGIERVIRARRGGLCLVQDHETAGQ